MENPSAKKASRLNDIELLLLAHPEGLLPAEIARRLGTNRSTREFRHNHLSSRVKMLPKVIRRGISDKLTLGTFSIIKGGFSILMEDHVNKIRNKPGGHAFLRVVWIITFLVVFVSSSTASSQPSSNRAALLAVDVDRWQTLESMTRGRGDPGFVEANGKLHAIGGFRIPGQYFEFKHEVYDPLTGHWTAATNPPETRSDFVIAYVANKIYITGGWNNSPGVDPPVTASTFRYDPGSGVWNTTDFLPMPTPVSGAAGVVLNDQIYVLGGIEWINGALASTNAVQIYNVGADTWSPGVSMLRDRNEFQAVVWGGRIYAIGGQDGTLYPDDDVEIFDPVANEWSLGPSFNGVRYSMGVAVRQGLIYVIGGFANRLYNAGLDTVLVLDPLAGTWTTAAPMPTARGANRAAVFNDIIYVIGGIGETGAGVALEAYGLFPSPINLPFNRK